MIDPARVNLIVTTYNRPDALALCLRALAEQSVTGFRVYVADDGSGADTARLLREMATPYPLRHVWQPDDGFRAARARNLALAQTTGDYIIFLDGDCIPPRPFVARHCQLAEPGWFVAGNRLLCTAKFTAEITQHALPVWQWHGWRWLWAWRGVNRLTSLARLPLGPLRKLRPHAWQGVKTCNLGVWRNDLLRINGFDEAYQGWGHEDADLAARLIRAGVTRKEGRFAAPVIHLWHAENSRASVDANLRRLRDTLATTTVAAKLGVRQYL